MASSKKVKASRSPARTAKAAKATKAAKSSRSAKSAGRGRAGSKRAVAAAKSRAKSAVKTSGRTASRTGAKKTPAKPAKRSSRRSVPARKPASGSKRQPARPARKKATASAVAPISATKAMAQARPLVAAGSGSRPIGVKALPPKSVPGKTIVASGKAPAPQPTSVASDLGLFRAGDQVKHKVFGLGRVVGVEGFQLQIAFKSLGTKTIIDSFVQPLRR